MTSYGIPYQGSKARIAPWIVEQLPAAPVLVDLFAGGCAVTHAAIISGKFERVIANDLTGAPGIFLQAVNGEFDGYATVPTHEEFSVSDDDVLRLLYSFGNNRRDYLWSRKLEAVKVPASRMLTAPSLAERRKHYREFMRALRVYIESEKRLPDIDRTHDGALQGLQRLERLQRLQGLQGLERLQRLQGLQGLERLQGLEVSRADYRDVAVPDGATVYADPPYRGTDCAAYDDFNFAAFDKWLASVEFPVFVSEYTAPNGTVEVASTYRQGSMAANGKSSKTVERLFVQERFASRFASA